MVVMVLLDIALLLIDKLPMLAVLALIELVIVKDPANVPVVFARALLALSKDACENAIGFAAVFCVVPSVK